MSAWKWPFFSPPGRGRAVEPETAFSTSLLLENVVPAAGWQPELGPLSLALGQTEFCLVEGLSTHAADLLLRVAATLQPPLAGRLCHWGREILTLPRRQLYPWRRRLAFVSPWQSLLPRLTVLENITLAQTLTSSRRAEAMAGRQQLPLEQLELTAYLDRYPQELPTRQYHLALWARELLKAPRLILGVLAGQEEPHGVLVLAPHLFPLLEEHHRQGRGAILLAGPWLAPAHALADRRLTVQADGWQEKPLPRRHHHPLATYLNLL